MASQKLPAFQFYPGDWRKDPGVQSLSYHDRGVWFEMLCLMHESDERGVLVLNGRPMPREALARLLGLDNQNLTTTLTTLITSGVASEREDGAISCRRMIRDEKLRLIRTEAGKKGGNPNLVNQNTTTHLNQNPTPSYSPSLSPSSSNKGIGNIAFGIGDRVGRVPSVREVEMEIERLRKESPDIEHAFPAAFVQALCRFVGMSNAVVSRAGSRSDLTPTFFVRQWADIAADPKISNPVGVLAKRLRLYHKQKGTT